MAAYHLIGGATAENLGSVSSWSLSNGGPRAGRTPTSSDDEMDLAGSILGTLTADELNINASITIANPVTTTIAGGGYTIIGNDPTGSVAVSSTWNSNQADADGSARVSGSGRWRLSLRP
jgi:hypothetical protein